MKKQELINPGLLRNVKKLVESARREAYKSINLITLQTNFEIGKLIVEEEQNGNQKANYGDELLVGLAKELTKVYGRGFSKSNLFLMRQFYLTYKKFQSVTGKFGKSKSLTDQFRKCQTLSGKFKNYQKIDKNYQKQHLKVENSGENCQSLTGKFTIDQIISGKLSWTHYTLLLQISDDNERKFYEKECENSNWSVRQLKRQIDSSIYQRVLLANSKKDKDRILELANQGITYNNPEDVIKEPVVLDLFGVNEEKPKYESDLEAAIVKHIEKFLLELGRGYMFVGSQYRISIAGKNYYVDLVFYNKILKCYVLIDLKINSFEAENVGQMNLYVNYFKNEINDDGDNDPIGIILCAEKDKVVAKYATDGLVNNIYASKYTYVIPDKEKLEEELERYLAESGN